MPLLGWFKFYWCRLEQDNIEPTEFFWPAKELCSAYLSTKMCIFKKNNKVKNLSLLSAVNVFSVELKLTLTSTNLSRLV